MCPFINAFNAHQSFFFFCPDWSSIQKHDTHASDISVLSFSTDQSEDSDQTRLVVGVIVGLLIATLVIGLAYWVYSKKSK